MKLLIKEAKESSRNLILLTIEADLDIDFESNADLSISDILDDIDDDLTGFIQDSCESLVYQVNDAIAKSNQTELKDIKFTFDDYETDNSNSGEQTISLWASAKVDNIINLDGDIKTIIQNAVDFADFDFSTTIEVDTDFIGYDQGPNYPAAGGPPVYDTEDVDVSASITVNEDIDLKYDDDRYSDIIRKTATINNRSYDVDTCASGNINVFPKFNCKANAVTVKGNKITVYAKDTAETNTYDVVDSDKVIKQIDSIISADYLD